MRHLVAAALLVVAGCSSVHGSAVRTGPLRLPPHVGEVAIYMASQPAVFEDVGVVEVHALQSEATVEKLLPLFVQKAALIGGNAAIVEKIAANFQMVERMEPESYVFPCGYYTCTGTRFHPIQYEVMGLSIQGRAALVRREAPAIPPVFPVSPQAVPSQEGAEP